MSNSDIAAIFKLYADLSELHNGNAFKIKTFTSASFRIDKMIEPLEGKTSAYIETIEGIGKTIAAKIVEINTRQSFAELDELLEATPKGVRELMRVKGIGPKKVAMIWKEMGIENVGELLYACKENRLAQAKGFGAKTQENILKQIEFMFVSANKFHYAKILAPALELLQKIQQIQGIEQASFIGDMRRKMEVIEYIEILISTQDFLSVQHKITESNALTQLLLGSNTISGKFMGYPVKINTTTASKFALELFKQTGSLTHVNKVMFKMGPVFKNFNSETEIYKTARLSYIEPEMRESKGEIEKASTGTLPKLIEFANLTGPLHNHSTWSDGANPIAEMAEYCKNKGYQYLGMADHSKSAFYANGLSEDKVLAQQKEIAVLNQQMGPDFKIFAGIESDILYDGSLDYDNDILATFDYIVASVHSILNMTEEKAMQRLIKAIENPYTTILGHPTGRLLLMREGYPLNHHKIIDACAANGVVIEINANPYRLDLDWRYIDYALKKGVMLSINPDAHEIAGFDDMFFGIEVARKGGLSKEFCLNAMNLNELNAYFTKRKAKI